MYFVPSLEPGETFTSESSKANDSERDTTTKPALGDLGEFILSFVSFYAIMV